MLYLYMSQESHFVEAISTIANELNELAPGQWVVGGSVAILLYSVHYGVGCHRLPNDLDFVIDRSVFYQVISSFHSEHSGHSRQVPPGHRDCRYSLQLGKYEVDFLQDPDYGRVRNPTQLHGLPVMNLDDLERYKQMTIDELTVSDKHLRPKLEGDLACIRQIKRQCQTLDRGHGDRGHGDRGHEDQGHGDRGHSRRLFDGSDSDGDGDGDGDSGHGHGHARDLFEDSDDEA